jgi:protein-L-isoaspartate(D-aspartate) O-methyltransferase
VSEALARHLAGRGIRDPRVLEAVERLPRSLFVPRLLRAVADVDAALPIGHGQTISQPFVVAVMTEALALAGTEKVLEVGTGSGYQAAVLALLAREVYSVELLAPLAERAREVLCVTLGLANVHLRIGDGAAGWPEAAPFDRIVVTAAAPAVPPALLEQLAPGGRMILPVGPAAGTQVLRLVEKGADGSLSQRDLHEVVFVPLRSPG